MRFPQPSRAHERLSRDDERELAETIRRGLAAEQRITDGAALEGDDGLVAQGRVAKNRFVAANVGLVIHLATRFPAPRRIDRDDLIQDGMLGLERAIQDFEPERGWKFSTYAAWWIRRFIQQGLETTMAPVRIPAHRLQGLRQQYALERDGARPELDALDRRAESMVSMGSLDAPVAFDSGTTVGAQLSAQQPGPDLLIEHDAERTAASALLAQLDPDAKALVAARFGLDGDEPVTLAELAEQRGVSAEAVRRRILRSLEKLRPHAERLVAA